ncbi:hypothetical protein PVK06_012234 [Gossypium arboreum]|uniref:Uncharacterized protein n=1 Tax=Gossypium arboreum TaxID=29729 RepID=A0ABR0QAY5_GOSAR|nr:hypothetical protein PVK06_012234 [Gossypium arboreum]
MFLFFFFCFASFLLFSYLWVRWWGFHRGSWAVMENDLATLQISEAEDDEILIVAALTTPKPLYDLCLVGFFMASVIHFPAMRTALANLWHPLGVGDVPITDLGDKRFLFQFFYRVVTGAP